MHAKRPQRLQESDEIAVDRAIHVLGMFAGALGSAALIWVALRPAEPRWRVVADYRLLGLPNGHALLLSGVQLFRKHATPRNTSACRPRSNLPSDRRHIHAIYHTHAARKMEFLDDWLDLGVSISGRSFQAGMSASAGARGSRLIPCARLGDCRCMEAASRRHRFGNGFPDPQRRNPVHNRCHLSCVARSAVPECASGTRLCWSPLVATTLRCCGRYG